MMAFQKGTSGNPAGRPIGIPDSRSKLRALIEEAGPALVASAISQAPSGPKLRLALLDRLVPSYRSESVRVPIEVDPKLAPEQQVPGILAQLRDGKLAMDDAAALIGALQRQGELAKIGVLADAVAALLIKNGLPLPPDLAARAAIAKASESPIE